MKLLLTSEAIANNSLAEALLRLLSRPAKETDVAYIPTAANSVSGDKRWLVRNLRSVTAMPFRCVDIVELSDSSRAATLDRLARSHVIVLGGGNAFHLLDTIDQLDLRAELRTLATERVIVGSSASAMVLGPSPALASQSAIWGDLGHGKDPCRPGLELVNFYVRPHLDRADDPICAEPTIRAKAESLAEPTYAIDDASGITVVDGHVTTVGTGRVVRIEPASSSDVS